MNNNQNNEFEFEDIKKKGTIEVYDCDLYDLENYGIEPSYNPIDDLIEELDKEAEKEKKIKKILEKAEKKEIDYKKLRGLVDSYYEGKINRDEEPTMSL